MDKPIPEPGPNDAVVRTSKALICTSDSPDWGHPAAQNGYPSQTGGPDRPPLRRPAARLSHAHVRSRSATGTGSGSPRRPAAFAVRR
jgi:hypothetical protein